MQRAIQIPSALVVGVNGFVVVFVVCSTTIRERIPRKLTLQSEAETMEGIEAFVSDPGVLRMRKEAGIDTDSQELINSIGNYHIFPS